MVPFTGVGKTRGKRNKITSFRVGTRMKSFTLAILSLRCPLEVQVAMPSRPGRPRSGVPGKPQPEILILKPSAYTEHQSIGSV